MHKLRFIWHDLHASSPVTVYDKKFALIFGENLSIHTTSVLQIVSSIARFLPIRNQTEHFLSKGHYEVVVLLLHTSCEIPAHRKPIPSSFPSRGCPGVPVHEGIPFVFITIHGVMTQFVNVSFLWVPVHEDTTPFPMPMQKSSWSLWSQFDLKPS